MRVKCPDCGVKAPIFTIEHKNNNDVDLSCRCINTECLSQFVMTVHFMHHTNKHKKVRAQKKAPKSVLSIVNRLNADQKRDLAGILAENIKNESCINPLGGEQGCLVKLYDTRQQVYGKPDYLIGIDSAMLNNEATIFHRYNNKNGTHHGYILYTTNKNMTDEMEDEKADCRG